MEEDQGRASPSLPRGSYNIDFDTLDDSFNPFQTKKDITNSPTLERKDFSNSTETVPADQPACDQVQESSLLKGPDEKPKRKKSKSPAPKQTSGVADSADGQGGDGSQVAGAVSEETAVAEKPVKTKKIVKKPKSRPVSKNLEGQGTTPEVNKTQEGAEASGTAAPTGDSHAILSQPKDVSSDLPQDSTSTVDVPKPVREKKSKSPQPEQSSQDSEKHPDNNPVKKQEPDSSPPIAEASQQTPPKTATASGEVGVDSPPKKERSSGKVKKTKTKVKKSPRSAESGVDRVDSPVTVESGKEGKSSPRASSQGDLVVDLDVQKVKHPAARVLEQQVKDDQCSQAKNNFPTDSEDDFYDAYDTSPPVKMDMLDNLQSYSDMNDSCMLFQSQDDLGGLSWSQEDSTLLDGGAGEAAFTEDLTLGDSDMADSRGTESVVKLVQVLKYSQSDWNKLRQELELNFQAQLLAKEREWSSKLADRDTRLATLEDTNKKLRQTNDDMRAVMAEFEKTIGQLQSEKEKTTNASQQSLQDVIKERDQALEDLQSVETAFSDLHRRYEKTKGVVDGFKQNEEMLKKCVQDLQNKLKKAETMLQVVKEQAEEKLERATEEIEKTQKSAASEVARLEAALRKADLQVESMQCTVDQKIKENKELAAICDELIAKVQ